MWTGVGLNLFLREFRPNDILDPICVAFSSRVFYILIPIMIFTAFYWCIDKKTGEFIGMSAMASMAISMTVKYGINMPRPFDEYEELLLDDKAAVHAEGPSCPSGHAAISTSAYGSAIYCIGKSWISVLFFIIMFMVIFSRLWLGVHTPLDIIASIILAIAVMIVMKKLIDLSYRDEKTHLIIDAALLVSFTVMYVVAFFCWNVSADYLAYVSGAFYGAVIGRAIENKYVKFEVPETTTKSKVKRYLIGILVAAVVLVAFMVLLGNNYGTGVGGFLIMIWIFAYYPYLLKGKWASL